MPTNYPALPTEEEIRKQASSLYEPAHKQAVDTLTQQKSGLTTQYGRSLADYGKYVEDVLSKTKSSIGDQLIKRGMGRSTRAVYEMTEGLADVNANAQEHVKQLGEDYNASLANYDTQMRTLNANKEQNVQGKILDLMQYYEGIRQFNAQMALREKELARSRGGGGGPAMPTGLVDLTEQGAPATSTNKWSTMYPGNSPAAYLPSGPGAGITSAKATSKPKSTPSMVGMPDRYRRFMRDM